MTVNIIMIDLRVQDTTVTRVCTVQLQIIAVLFRLNKVDTII